jgi:hypothetical protein
VRVTKADFLPPLAQTRRPPIPCFRLCYRRWWEPQPRQPTRSRRCSCRRLGVPRPGFPEGREDSPRRFKTCRRETSPDGPLAISNAIACKPLRLHAWLSSAVREKSQAQPCYAREQTAYNTVAVHLDQSWQLGNQKSSTSRHVWGDA